MPEKHTENAAPPADRARRVLHVRRRRADPAPTPPEPKRRRLPVMVASFAMIAFALIAVALYVVARQDILLTPPAASAEQPQAAKR
jgi:hypothetical protein